MQSAILHDHFFEMKQGKNQIIILYGYEELMLKINFKRRTYGLKCLGKILAYLMSFFLHICDQSVPYFASLEAWIWVVTGQHLDASHLRPNQNDTIY